jgi:hypothetical protein
MFFRVTTVSLLVASFTGCTGRYVDPLGRPLVDSVEAVKSFEGKAVRLVGEVSNTKIPQIHGVDVSSDNPDLRGQQAEAYGVLRRFVVSETEALEMDQKLVAHRGAGTYWVLENPKTKAPSQVMDSKESLGRADP